MKKLYILFLFILTYFQITAQTLIPYLKVNGKIIYVDSARMKPAFDKEFDEGFPFAEGFASVKQNGKYGYIDKTGKPIIEFKYEDGDDFINGIARVVLDNKTGLIDKTGKEIFPFKYPFISDFSDGIAVASLDEKYGYIDITGKEIIPIKYDDISGFIEGLARVELNGKYGFINKSGNIVVPVKYDDAMNFSNGVAVVGLNNKYGFIDKKGKEIIPLKYHHASTSFGEHLLVTIDSGSIGFRRGYIDRAGKVIIPFKYSQISEFTKGIYLTKSGDKIQLINAKLVKLAEWDNYESGRNISEGIAFLQIKKGLADGEKFVMINNAGKEVGTARFDAVGDFKNGVAPVKSDGKWFFIDKTGKPLFPNKYDDLHSFDKTGITSVSLNNRWFYIDKAGREFREKEKPLAAGWLFFDEFDDNRNGWSIDTTNKDFQTKFSTGDYDVWNKRDDQSRFLLRKIPGWNEKNNFRIEITMHYSAVGPDNMGNGLIIGCDEKFSNYYRFMFNKQGQYRIDQSVIGKIVPLQDWKESTDILPYGDNKLGFTHINGKWAFYVNEKKIYEMNAKEFFGEGIGMFIGPGSSYYCRSFKVYNWTKAAADPDAPKEFIREAVFTDDFKSNKNNWYVIDDKDVTASFRDNAYRIKVKYDGFYMSHQTLPVTGSDNHRVDITLRRDGGGDRSGFGLCFGQKDVDNAFAFLITSGGLFQVGKYLGGTWYNIKDWAESHAINIENHKINRLAFENLAGKWNFYINDTLVYSCPSQSFFGNKFGCYVEKWQTIEFLRMEISKITLPY